MHDYQWLSSLQINLNRLKEEITYMPEIMVDYFKNDKLDLDMLSSYLSIFWVINKKVNGKEYFIKYPMKYCTKEMFLEHNIDPVPRDVDKKRLCPDISHSDLNYFA